MGEEPAPPEKIPEVEEVKVETLATEVPAEPEKVEPVEEPAPEIIEEIKADIVESELSAEIEKIEINDVKAEEKSVPEVEEIPPAEIVSSSSIEQELETKVSETKIE